MNLPIVSKLYGAGRIVLNRVRKSKPEIALVVGGVSMLVGTVWACTKTKEAVDANEIRKREIEDFKDNHDEITTESVIEYSKIYGRFLYKLAKLYGIPAILWIAGMGSITSAHVTLRKENTKLILDTVAFKKMFDEYRNRMKEEIGEEREREIYFDSRENEIEIVEVNPETGTKKITKKKGNVLRDNTGSKFARNFSERTSWEFDVRSYADYFLEERIKMLNNRLHTMAFMTINEVYDELGMKPEYGRCRDGLDWGWVWNPSNPDGPNEIVIERLTGWEEVYDERDNRYYYEPCLRIDFNCQYIRDLI